MEACMWTYAQLDVLISEAHPIYQTEVTIVCHNTNNL